MEKKKTRESRRICCVKHVGIKRFYFGEARQMRRGGCVVLPKSLQQRGAENSARLHQSFIRCFQFTPPAEWSTQTVWKPSGWWHHHTLGGPISFLLWVTSTVWTSTPETQRSDRVHTVQISKPEPENVQIKLRLISDNKPDTWLDFRWLSVSSGQVMHLHHHHHRRKRSKPAEKTEQIFVDLWTNLQLNPGGSHMCWTTVFVFLSPCDFILHVVMWSQSGELPLFAEFMSERSKWSHSVLQLHLSGIRV